jgi:hypothetical protein
LNIHVLYTVYTSDFLIYISEQTCFLNIYAIDFLIIIQSKQHVFCNFIAVSPLVINLSSLIIHTFY